MTINLLDQIGDFSCGDSFPVEHNDGRFQVIRPSGTFRDQFLVELAFSVARNGNMRLTLLCIKFAGIAAIAAAPRIVASYAVLAVSEELGQFDP